MAMVRKSSLGRTDAASEFTPEQRAGFEASQNEIDARADRDEVNPTWTDDELDRAQFARLVRQTRSQLGMTQSVFAARFHIALRRLHDWEQARHKPDTVAAAYIKTISFSAEVVENALRSVSVSETAKNRKPTTQP